jgi:hypothetical protein
MPVTTKVDVSPSSKTYSFRVHKPLGEQLEAIAARDSNSVGATIRRLISRALRSEEQHQGQRHG